MANPRISIFSKKVIRTNTENSVEVGLFVPSLIHSFSFVYSNSKKWLTSFFTCKKFTYIKMCYAYVLPSIKKGQQHYMQMLK